MSDGPHSYSHASSSVLCPSPLSGWRVVITRAAEQGDGLAERLRATGAEPIIYPTIAFAPPEHIGPLDEALSRLADGAYDWLVLTSANAVRAVYTESRKQKAESSLPGSSAFCLLPSALCHIAAVGPATAAACRDLLGREPSVVPERFVAEGLAAALGEMRDQQVLVLNSDLARPTLVNLLRDAGAYVDRVIAYRTVPATGGPDLPALLTAGQIDAITFASGSAVHFFVERIGSDMLEHARRTVIACIGPVTSEAARTAGLSPTVVAEQATEEGLVEALLLEGRRQKAEGSQVVENNDNSEIRKQKAEGRRQSSSGKK